MDIFFKFFNASNPHTFFFISRAFTAPKRNGFAHQHSPNIGASVSRPRGRPAAPERVEHHPKTLDSKRGTDEDKLAARQRRRAKARGRRRTAVQNGRDGKSRSPSVCGESGRFAGADIGAKREERAEGVQVQGQRRDGARSEQTERAGEKGLRKDAVRCGKTAGCFECH